MIAADSDEFNEDYFNFYDFTATVEGDENQGEENAAEINEDSSEEELIEDLPRSIYCDLESTFHLNLYLCSSNNYSQSQHNR